jgi:hypothetical protein
VATAAAQSWPPWLLTLQSGQELWKHSKWGSSKLRHVRYDPGNDRIDWGNVKKSISLGDVTDLKLGKQTAVFKRFSYRSADAKLCFSLVTAKRTYVDAPYPLITYLGLVITCCQ